MNNEASRLRDVAEQVIEHPTKIRELDLLDRLAVALILDRRAFLPDGEFTILQAVDCLGPERVAIAIAVEKALLLKSMAKFE